MNASFALRYHLLHSFIEADVACKKMRSLGLSLIVCHPEWPSVDEVTQFVAVALQHGCQAFVFVGENAEQCHNVADDVLTVSDADLSNVVTTFHDPNKESPAEIINFAVIHCKLSQIDGPWLVVLRSDSVYGFNLLRQIEIESGELLYCD